MNTSDYYVKVFGRNYQYIPNVAVSNRGIFF